MKQPDAAITGTTLNTCHLLQSPPHHTESQFLFIFPQMILFGFYSSRAGYSFTSLLFVFFAMWFLFRFGRLFLGEGWSQKPRSSLIKLEARYT